MNITILAPIAVFSCLLPIGGSTPIFEEPASSASVNRVARVTLVDDSQTTRAVCSAELGDTLREQLRSADQASPDLGSMRAGGVSENEWKWLAIGAGIVILIVLL